jgi:hypothetical protein
MKNMPIIFHFAAGREQISYRDSIARYGLPDGTAYLMWVRASARTSELKLRPTCGLYEGHFTLIRATLYRTARLPDVIVLQKGQSKKLRPHFHLLCLTRRVSLG